MRVGWRMWADTARTIAVMKADVYIVGTHHPLQCGADTCSAEEIADFKIEIRRILSEFGIRRIVEEMSPDGLKEKKVAETVCQRIARHIVVDHFDLGRQDRQHLSLEKSVGAINLHNLVCGGSLVGESNSTIAFDDLVNSVRERLLVARVLSSDEWPVLLVCGSEHTISLQGMFCELRVRCKIVHRDYEP